MRLIGLFLGFLFLVPHPVEAGRLEVVQLTADTYMVTKSSKAGIFVNMSKLKSKVIKRANEFAASKGKVAVGVFEKETSPAVAGWPTYEYRFRLVDPDAPQRVTRPDQSDGLSVSQVRFLFFPRSRRPNKRVFHRAPLDKCSRFATVENIGQRMKYSVK